MKNTKFTNALPDDLLTNWIQLFERQRAFANHAFHQLNDEQFFSIPAPGLNSCAIIANHLSGNMISRWTDFLTTDGEKLTRDRDTEFEPPKVHNEHERKKIMGRLDQGWGTLFDTLRSLNEDDLGTTIMIRNIPHPIHAAISRQIDHYSFHIGQLNIIARLQIGTQDWKWFTIPPGGSKAFNNDLMNQDELSSE